ncbi:MULTISPECIES: DUF3742 family protein [Pseudomonadota]|jgi:Flp pilus assembly protein TadB|uniref:DUF3742 family protein n=1 Tax=Aquabacterium soli TaxID=2493092 RepID=A0A3R8S556_9BURK|nr:MULTISPECIES: DUF3742 family protein [Pseudomonadota]ALY92278.1 hypothetical protein HW02_24790 [Pseudomonas aeruginosa]ALY94428.1 hypothetical protein HW01_03515 [Pseudomonas aeruginosa]ALZ39633.1 hypothetical protein HW11_25460 [Pseudomonas aeruginosa]EIU3163245.1 DUF3742 family protein [Pseudomonas aeruginosa]EIU4291168.1 DUF3742 family protein [Pseudomonas aeruginosa]
MNTTTRIGTAERLGRSLGRGWRAYARGERRASNWLVSKGVPAVIATALVWVVKLVALGMLVYTTFWLALLLVCVMVVAWMARNADLGEGLPEPEWRNGPAGFGLYTYDGFRIDPHVEDD